MPRSQKTEKRFELVRAIETFGFLMACRCLRCEREDLECVKSERSLKCSNCVGKGVRCSENTRSAVDPFSSGPSSRDLRKLVEERERLRAAKSVALTKLRSEEHTSELQSRQYL